MRPPRIELPPAGSFLDKDLPVAPVSLSGIIIRNMTPLPDAYAAHDTRDIDLAEGACVKRVQRGRLERTRHGRSGE